MFSESTLITRLLGMSDATEDYIEVPGAYQGSWSISSEPVVNLHPKLVRFLPTVPLVKHLDGKYCRLLSILGSDGETYNFAVVSAPDQVISSLVSERVVRRVWIIIVHDLFQINFGSICFWLNNGLRKSTEAYLRDAELKQYPIILLGKGIALMQLPADSFSLADSYESYCMGLSEPTSKFDTLLRSRLQLEELIATEEPDDALQKSKKALLMSQLSTYPSTVLRSYVRSSCVSAEIFYGRARTFASQLGLQCGLSVLLNSANNGKTENIFFSCREDALWLSGSFNFNMTGLEPVPASSGEVLPFRLTRSMTNALTPVLVLGSLASCMGCLFDVGVSNVDYLEVTFKQKSYQILYFLISRSSRFSFSFFWSTSGRLLE
jgi:phosphatidylinositol kinase/protein kinase (PI-3  family)